MKAIIIFILTITIHPLYAQNPDFGKFFSQVKVVKDEVKHDTLFSFGDYPISNKEYFLEMNRTHKGKLDKSNLFSFLEEFISFKLMVKYAIALNLHNSNDFGIDLYVGSKSIPKEDPHFSFLLKNYAEGLLFFDIQKDSVWDKSSNDTFEIKKMYQTNPKFQNSSFEKAVPKIKAELSKLYKAQLEQRLSQAYPITFYEANSKKLIDQINEMVADPEKQIVRDENLFWDVLSHSMELDEVKYLLILSKKRNFQSEVRYEGFYKGELKKIDTGLSGEKKDDTFDPYFQKN